MSQRNENALKYKIWLKKKVNLSRGFSLAGEQMKKRKHIAPTYEEDKFSLRFQSDIFRRLFL